MSLAADLRDFYAANPGFDVDAVDLVSAARGAGAPDGTLRAALLGHQRLNRLGLSGQAALGLLDRGLHSAHAIAELTREEFVDAHADLFEEGAPQAARAHREAEAVKSQVVHLWVNVHGLTAAAARGLPSDTVPESLRTFFSDQPDYSELFGDPDYCTCEHCRSMFGPAAYFVDLMRIIDRYVTRPNAATIPAAFTLERRRPDLFDLELSCANTNDTIPTLRVVNDVLARLVREQLGVGDALRALAARPYPTLIPYNDPLQAIRLHLGALGTSLAGLWDALRRPALHARVTAATDDTLVLDLPEGGAVPLGAVARAGGAARVVTAWDAAARTVNLDAAWTPPAVGTVCAFAPDDAFVAREALGLSREQGDAVTRAATSPEALRAAYGLTDAQPLTDLDDAALFRRQMALSRPALDVALLQNMGAADIAAGLAHGLFINRPLADAGYVHVAAGDGGRAVLVGLTERTLDRFDRFHRLSRWTGLTPADLDRLLAAAGADDIGPHVLLDLAAAVELAGALGAPLDRVCALWADLSTLTTGAEPGAASPFDGVFNRPDLLNGGAPYHPAYAGNPLYRDTPATLTVGGAEMPSGGFGRTRVMAALGFDDDALDAALRLLAADGETVTLDIGTLTRLHRAGLLGRALRLRPSALGALLGLMGASLRDSLPPALVRRVLVAARALAAAGLSPAGARDLIGPAVPASQRPALAYGAMTAVWSMLRPALLEPLSFAGVEIDAAHAQAAFAALLAHPDLVTDVTAAYAAAPGGGGPLAIVPAPVTAAQLAFLGAPPLAFDAAQIAAVCGALGRVYAAQVQGLVEQLAAPLGASTERLQAAVTFSDALQGGARPWLPVLLTPVPEHAAPASGTVATGWPAVLDTFAPLVRLLDGCAALGISGAELAAYARNPAPFGLAAPAPLDLDGLLAILGYRALLASLGCAPAALWAVLDAAGDARCADGEKSARLAALTGWPRAQICAAAERTAGGPAGYDTIYGLLRLKAVFDGLAAVGADMRLTAPLTALADLRADDEAGWRFWQDAAGAVAALTAARFPAAGWAAVAEDLAGRLDEARRDALEATVIWQLGREFPDITDGRRLYAFLLLDVETGGCASTSRIAEGLAALQLYLQRCRLNMETGVEKLPIPAVWQDWMMNYRVWEANRKIFLYPENYLIPSVRRTKSSLFRALEDALLQARVDDTAVARAYRDYLTGFHAVATLTVVDAYRCRRFEDEAAGTETLYLFARTQAEPYVYHYAMKGAEGVWSEWRKIDAAINSDTITPVYAFGRLMVFWVELKQTADPQFRAEGTTSVSVNAATYTASVYFSFPDVNGAWTAPQIVAEPQTVYVAPSATPFGAVAGALFDMTSLFWRKVNVLHVPGEKLVDANTPGERVVVLYGPFLENDITVTAVTAPDKPDAAARAVAPQRYAFDLALFDTSVEVNQAVASRVRGSLALHDARTFNIDLNADCLVRGTEFLVLVENLSAGVPPAIEPQLDVAAADLRVSDTRNPLRTNYAGDVTHRLGQSKGASQLVADAFVAPGIDATASGQVRTDLIGNGIVDGATFKVLIFSRNTNLGFLFPGESDPKARALKVAVVREEVLRRLQADMAVAADAFVVPAVDATRAATVLAALEGAGLVSNAGAVAPGFDSRTSLDFLFPGEAHAALLRGEVRRVMLDALAAPLLLGSVAREAARVLMVKNQPGWFILNNGNESFLVAPTTEAAPPLDAALRVRDSASPQRVYGSSFRTPLITPTYSQQVFRDLLGNHIIDADGVVISFSTRTKLSFLFPNVAPPSLRATMISQVRAILLGLPTLTALSYYQELPAQPITGTCFVSALVTGAESAAAFAALTANGVVLDRVISAGFGPGTDLGYLFPASPADLRRRQIADVRAILDRFYAATWQITVHDLAYRFERLSTAAAPRLMAAFLAGGTERLLALPSQQAPVAPVQPFSQYHPDAGRVRPPALPDGAQADFDGPYGLYYWELFLFAPQLVASTLAAGQRFDEALGWMRHVFDPTRRPAPPLSPDSFLTPDIREGDSADAFAALKDHGVVTAAGGVTPGFGPGTDLGYLFPTVDDRAVRDLMIGEVRAILLNARLSAPASRFWQFAPFRTHTLESLIDAVTDPAQIAAYNNAPFDPFAIARLRIGAFEKAVFRQYVDTLILWGDALFARPTRESLNAAQLVYMYAAELLGARPLAVGACKTQGPTTFAAIRSRYTGDIPQFLIRLENLLPKRVGRPLAAVRTGAVNEVEAVFCIPENDQLLGLWDRVEDRLYKLRHCLDLEGRPLRLALFEPPIDPLALARAAAAGGTTGVAVAQSGGLSVPIYRFDQLMLQARSLAATVGALGMALASALQQRDFERLQQLRASQEIALLNLQTESRRRDIEGIRRAIEGGQASLASADKRKTYYTDLADEFISPAEIVALLATDIGVRFRILGATLQTASGIAYAVPQVGSPFALTYGGIQLGNNLAGAANAANAVSTVSDYIALTATTLGGYRRRQQDWRFQAAQADGDIQLYTAQIAEARVRLAGAEQELRVNQLSIEQSKANAEFLTSKFDSRDLYNWTSARLTTLYYQTYQLALAAALAAQSAYRFQLGRDADFVNLQYWDSGRNGLLAGETLTLSLDQMDQSYARLNARRAEITKAVSLLDLAPDEFLRLKTTGECRVRLDEALFDFDFPGHYNRRVVTMGVAVVFATTFQPEAHVTLSQARNDTLVRPDTAGLRWLLNPVGDAPASVRRNLLPNQTVAVATSPTDYNGMGVFEVSLNYDPRYFPFEGTGAVSEWRIEMPKATNRFDFEDVSDVTLTLRYTALDGGRAFRDAVEEALAGATWVGGTYVDAKSAEEAAWTAFMADHADPARQTLVLTLRRVQLPANLSHIAVTGLTLVLRTDVDLPATSSFLGLTPPGAARALALPLARDWGSLAFADAVATWQGDWSITVDLAAIRADARLRPLLAADGFLDPARFADLDLVFALQAAAFPARGG